jgi:hypothetical protein
MGSWITEILDRLAFHAFTRADNLVISSTRFGCVLKGSGMHASSSSSICLLSTPERMEGVMPPDWDTELFAANELCQC